MPIDERVHGAVAELRKYLSAGGQKELFALLVAEGLASSSRSGGRVAEEAEKAEEDTASTQHESSDRPAAARAKHNLSDKEMAALRQRLKRRLRAASYAYGGQNLKGLFEQWDLSGDGLLSDEEFLTAVRRIVKLSPRESRAIVAVLDADGNGMIDKAEFFDFVRTNKTVRRDLRYVDMDPTTMKSDAPVHGYLRRSTLGSR